MIFAGLLALTSCQYIPTVSQKDLNQSYVKKTEAEAKIAELEKTHQIAISTNAEALSKAKDGVINGQDTQLQAGADALYSIQQAAAALPAAGAMEFTKARSVEGFTAMGKPPTIKEIIEGGERLKKYLNSYQNNDPKEIEALRLDHARLVKENGILVETTSIAKKDVENVKQEKLVIEQKYITDNSAAQTQLNLANNNVIEKEKLRLAAAEEAQRKAEDWKALIHQLMLWCGIGSVLALVGVIYSPIGKGGLGLIAGILGAVTICLPFIQPWMIWIVLGAVLIGAAAAIGNFLYKHNQAEVANKNIISAIQDTKETPNATIDDLKKNLAAWNTKYVKDKAGNIVSVVDDKVENYIKSKLAEIGRLDVSPTDQSTKK